MGINNSNYIPKSISHNAGYLKYLTMSLFLLLNNNSISKVIPPTNLGETTRIENTDKSYNFTTLASAVKARNYFIHKSIDHFSNEDITHIPLRYGKYHEGLKNFSKNYNFNLPNQIKFDAKNQQLLVGDMSIKIEVPPFDYIHETLLFDLDLHIKTLKFTKFTYDKSEDTFLFTIDMDYDAKDSESLDRFMKVFGLDSSTKDIPFSKDGLKDFLKIYTTYPGKLNSGSSTVVDGSYDMIDKGGKKISEIKLKMTAVNKK